MLNSIHPSKITGGASGALRQEFRELELLDDITALQFNNKLPTKIAMADRRNTLIEEFRKWKGEKYLPSAMHPAIRWSKTDPFLELQDTADWRVIDSNVDSNVKSTSSSVPSDTIPVVPGSESNGPGSTHIISELKRKRIVVPSKKMQMTSKKVKFCHRTTIDDLSAPIRLNVPLGTQWQNNSCAYDAIITILFNIWYDPSPSLSPNPEPSTSTSFEDTQCILFNALIQSFHSHRSSSQVESASTSATFSLEEIRDYFRRRLARLSQEFTLGSYTSVQSIAEYLFHAEEIVTTSDVSCPEGHSQKSTVINIQLSNNNSCQWYC
jgi:hypothetical protein